MNLNFNDTQYSDNPQSVSATARLLMSARRQKVQSRSQSMLNRAAAELGVTA